MSRNSERFTELLETYYSNAMQYCIVLAKSRDDAKDLLQEALIKALLNFDSLKDEKKFKPWLFKIITRTFYAAYHGELAKRSLLQKLPFETTEMPSVFKNEISDPDVRALIKGINNLKKKEKVALVLFEIGGFSIEEIRQIQGENSLSAIKSRLSRARSALKEFLTGIRAKTFINYFI